MTTDMLQLSAELGTDAEQAIVEAFAGSDTSTIVAVVDAASQRQPAYLVREAYWDLVTRGRIVPTADGALHLKR